MRQVHPFGTVTIGGFRQGRRLAALGRPKAGSEPDRAEALFEASVVDWAEDLGRLAFLLTGDQDAAQDLVADALMAAWKRWPQVSRADNPQAYVRRIVVNMAASRVRVLTRERARLDSLKSMTSEAGRMADISAGLDLQEALKQLPRRQRECVVLRYGLELSEKEVAEALLISVGAVKSSTHKGARLLRSLLDQPDLEVRGPAA